MPATSEPSSMAVATRPPPGPVALLVAGVWVSGRRRSAQEVSTLRWVVLGAAVPTGASVAMEALGVFEGSAVIRAAGAIPLGAAVTWVVSFVIRGELA